MAKRSPFQGASSRRLLPGTAAASVAAMAILGLAAHRPEAIRAYQQTIFPKIIFLQTRLTDPLPFSLAEVLLLLSGASALAFASVVFVQAIKRKRSIANSLYLGLLATAAVSPILPLGYLLWGLNYGGPGLAAELSWEPTGMGPEESLRELKAASQESVLLANENYRREMEHFRFSSSPADVDTVLEEGFTRSFAALGLENPNIRLKSRAKPFCGSLLLSWWGISGFYFPWTGEANYNPMIPVPERIVSIAHEKAHQRGITGEDEANFAAFLATTFSRDPQVRYAGYLFAQVQLVGQLARMDERAAARLLRMRDPGVEIDRQASRRFWARFEGRGMKMAEVVNDSYLRLHGVQGGLDSYNRSAGLLILFHRHHGSLAP